ncbi:MAG TPA: lamin tail domain-containing protein [Pyrinomonadaceae bacterium]|nr:lamin tail domain-containing protein [Pyrinomonadaceae bacterium]
MGSLSRPLVAAIFACGLFLLSAPHAPAQTPPVQPGQFIISELRFRGPAGDEDEFIEFYNNTDAEIVVASVDGSPGWALVADDGVVRFVIPNGTRIPARGHLLAANSDGYSLTAYPAGDPEFIIGVPVTPVIGPSDRRFEPLAPEDGNIGGEEETAAASPFGTATPNVTYDVGIDDFGGVALFTSTVPAQQTLANRLDAFGFTPVPTLYREGAGKPTTGVSEREASYYRDLRGNLPKDTDQNAADFLLVGTSADTTGNLLGAPGPENLRSPVQTNAGFAVDNLDPQLSASGAPNRVRTTAPVRNGDLGTLIIRRTFTNNTGRPVTRLRFRVIDLTTLGSPAVCGANGTSPCADMRVLSSQDGQASSPNIGTVAVRGVKLEEPPEQDSFHGGGLNSSLSAEFINTRTPLAPGERVNIQFTLGIMRGGTFRFFINIEALVAPETDEPGPPGV